MSRLRPVGTEIARSIDKARSEVVLPDPVDDDSCGERIVRRRNPFGESLSTLLFGCVAFEAQGTDHFQRVRRHLFASGKRVASVKSIRRAGLTERSGVDDRRCRKFGLLFFQSREFSEPGFSLFRELRGCGFKIVGRLVGFRLRGKRRAVGRAGNGLPLTGLDCGFNPVFRRDAIAESSLPVTCPDDSVDLHGLRELQLDPAASTFVGNPTATVSNLPVVDVDELVNLVAGQIARRGWLHTEARQSNVLVPGEHFKFIDAGLTGVRRLDRKPNKLHSDGFELFHVEFRGDSRPELRAVCRLLNKLCEPCMKGRDAGLNPFQLFGTLR